MNVVDDEWRGKLHGIEYRGIGSKMIRRFGLISLDKCPDIKRTFLSMMFSQVLERERR